MSKQQVNIRLSEPGWTKLIELVEKYGSQTIVIELALDRLHHSEIGDD